MAWTPIALGHDDLVTDMAYDYYGQRVVTCSVDRTLRVFDIASGPETGTSTPGDGGDDRDGWRLAASWKCADAAILRVCWAAPEHGQIVACASADRTVRLFEELDHDPRQAGRWVERARLNDARGAVHSLAFAPSHQGLRLATLAADGVLRIYEALEPSNLTQWTLMDDFPVLEKRPARDMDSSFALSWCTSRFASPTLAVGAMDQVRLYAQDGAGKWRAGQSISHGGLVRDVCWAPAVGRTYHLLATACKDGHVRIFRLREDERRHEHGGGLDDVVDDELSAAGWSHELVADLTDHNAQVWRVSFNATGTVLSSAGDDAKVRLWKSSFAGDFRCVSVCSLQQSAGHDGRYS